MGQEHAIPASLEVPHSNMKGMEYPSLTIYASSTNCTAFAPLEDSYTNAGFSQATLTKLGLLLVALPAAGTTLTCL